MRWMDDRLKWDDPADSLTVQYFDVDRDIAWILTGIFAASNGDTVELKAHS